MSGEPRRGSAALLAGLPGIGPRRLTILLDRWEPEEAWAVATAGGSRALEPLRVGDPTASPDAMAHLARTWAAAAAERSDPVGEAARHTAAGVAVLLRDDHEYPPSLLEDQAPPPVLFARGHLSLLERPRVAIVGTRRCTGAGAGIARELGRDLSVAGIAVVSGLALGIDGAAHRGVLDADHGGHPGWAGPVGVVGCGHDHPYPARHRELWERVGERGLLLGAAPLGVRPAAWRFPARNRIIAALADVVVVVESHAGGGSLLTVREAMARDVDVMAVPGSVRSPAAAGTNQLLADGCHPVRDVDDVLVALGMVPGGRRGRAEPRPPPDAGSQALLDAFDWEPATLEHLALRTGRPVPDLALALHRLTEDGWLATSGAWYERVERR